MEQEEHKFRTAPFNPIFVQSTPRTVTPALGTLGAQLVTQNMATGGGNGMDLFLDNNQQQGINNQNAQAIPVVPQPMGDPFFMQLGPPLQTVPEYQDDADDEDDSELLQTTGQMQTTFDPQDSLSFGDGTQYAQIPTQTPARNPVQTPAQNPHNPFTTPNPQPGHILTPLQAQHVTPQQANMQHSQHVTPPHATPQHTTMQQLHKMQLMLLHNMLKCLLNKLHRLLFCKLHRFQFPNQQVFHIQKFLSQLEVLRHLLKRT